MKKQIFIAVAVALVSFIVCVPLFMRFEIGCNPQVNVLFDGIWWWVVTSATVGYGDVYPHTTAGRLIAIFAILTGFYVYSQGIALIAAATYRFIDRHQRGTALLRMKNHVVLCDYTAVADEWIQSLRHDPQWRHKPVAVVSDLIDSKPYPHCGFVHGVPLSPVSMRNANVGHASHVIVFANHRFGDPDLKSFHAAIRIQRLAPGARVFVECVQPNSEMAARLPKSITLLPSSEMMLSVLSGEGIEIRRWLGNAP